MIDAECQQLHNGVIIEVMFGLMGMVMGFLAFLMVGGLSAWCAWVFYPQHQRRKTGTFRNVLLSIGAGLVGFLGATAASYLGQALNVFQSGQMLEWLVAIFTACATGVLYSSVVK